jgi:hypothetical protein
MSFWWIHFAANDRSASPPLCLIVMMTPTTGGLQCCNWHVVDRSQPMIMHPHGHAGS